MSIMSKPMSGIAGAQAALESDASALDGHPMRCVQGQSTAFERGSAQLNTAVMSFLDRD